MARKSDITKYPDELIAYINKLIDENKHTYQEIVDLVNALIIDKYMDENELSHASLGRYAKNRRENFEAAVAQMQRQKAQRKEFFERFGDDGLDNAGRYVAEMSYSMIMDLQTVIASMKRETDDEGNEEPISLGELDLKSKIINRTTASIGNLEKSLSENKSRTDQIKKEAAEEARAEDIEKLKALGEDTKDGAKIIDEKTIKKIREQVYGVYS